MTAGLRLRGGRIYLDAATSDTFFPQREAVTLYRRDDDLYIIPLQDSAYGGFLLKIRTSAGDRVVDAEEFFREHGLDGTAERALVATWRADSAALIVRGLFRAAAAPMTA